MALHFNCCPSELDKEQILDYLLYCKNQHKTPSESFFKHTVYGLRALFHLKGLDATHVHLPSIERSKKLPVILSVEEVKQLINAPKLLKHRLVISMLYDCGLRNFELRNVKIADVDLYRKQLHIRQGKGRKDRYVPLSNILLRGLQTYLNSEKPLDWLFNGNNSKGEKVALSGHGVFWIVNSARKKSGLQKKVTAHMLRHSYATHLLEMGLDIVSLKELLGHSRIETTMVYLHISQLGRSCSFAPLDRLYPFKGE